MEVRSGVGPVMVELEREVALVMKLSSRGEERRSLTVGREDQREFRVGFRECIE